MYNCFFKARKIEKTQQLFLVLKKSVKVVYQKIE